jgi:hypothetical protein
MIHFWINQNINNAKTFLGCTRQTEGTLKPDISIVGHDDLLISVQDCRSFLATHSALQVRFKESSLRQRIRLMQSSWSESTLSRMSVSDKHRYEKGKIEGLAIAKG